MGYGRTIKETGNHKVVNNQTDGLYNSSPSDKKYRKSFASKTRRREEKQMLKKALGKR